MSFYCTVTLVSMHTTVFHLVHAELWTFAYHRDSPVVRPILTDTRPIESYNPLMISKIIDRGRSIHDSLLETLTRDLRSFAMQSQTETTLYFFYFDDTTALPPFHPFAQNSKHAIFDRDSPIYTYLSMYITYRYKYIYFRVKTCQAIGLDLRARDRL